MKVAISADWHLDAISNGIARYPDLSRSVDEVVRRVGAECDVFVFAGDLCNPDRGARTLRAIGKAAEVAKNLALFDVESYWIAGNHDVVDSEEALSTLSPLIGGDGVVIEDVFSAPLDEKWWLVALPYISKLRFNQEEFLAKVESELVSISNDGCRALVVGHCTEVGGAKIGNETTLMARGRGMPFPVELCQRHGAVMVNGHYHKRQVTPDGIVIPGSLGVLDFGEEGNTPSFEIVGLF
jgi:DNA repair exonuclease SbcCD nuclease subunit